MLAVLLQDLVLSSHGLPALTKVLPLLNCALASRSLMWPAGRPEGRAPKPLRCAQWCEQAAQLQGEDMQMSGVCSQLLSLQSEHFLVLSYLAIFCPWLHFSVPHQQLQDEQL